MRRRLLLCAVLSFVSLGGTAPAGSQTEEDPCRILQITNAQGGNGAAVGAGTDIGGDKVVFEAWEPLLLGTGDGWEAFLFDPAAPAAGAVTRLTESPQAGVLAGSRIDENGRLVVYESLNDPVGENPDFSPEIFLLDRGSGTTRQLTRFTRGGGISGDSLAPDLSGDGRWVVFTSAQDFGLGAPAGSFQVYRMELASGAVQRISTGPKGGNAALINRDGTRVAFASSDDLVPGSNPAGKAQFFLADLPTGRLRQVAHLTQSFIGHCSLDRSGDLLAFEARADLVPGENPDLGSEIFLYSFPEDRLIQITHSAGSSRWPVISGNGAQILFSAAQTPDPSATGGDGTYFYQVRTGTFRKMNVQSSVGAALNENGSLVSFFGTNPNDGESIEVFAAICGLGLALLALVLGALGLWLLRRLSV